MANPLGTILGLGIAGVAGYMLYEKFFAGSTTSGAATTGTPSTTPPAPAYTPPTLASQLLAAAQGNANLIGGKMNAYQWEYILENSLKRPAQNNINSVFYPSGVPDVATINTAPWLITPDTFVSALGLSGYGLGARSNPAGNYRRAPSTPTWAPAWGMRRHWANSQGAWPVKRMIA